MARATAMTMMSRKLFPGRIIFPAEMGREQYYNPPERGFEREVKKRLDYWAKLRKERE